MTQIRPNSFLKRALIADAVVTGAVALAQLSATGLIVEWTGLAPALVTGTGVFLVGYVALLVALVTRARLPAAWLWLVIAGNAGWAAGALLVIEASELPAFGSAFAAVHALATLTFALLEYQGLRTSPGESAGFARSA